MLPALSEKLLSEWSRYFPDNPKPERISYLGIAGSMEGGTTSFLAFGERKRRPLFAVKVFRETADSSLALNECHILNKLNSSASPLLHSVPRAVLSERVGEKWATVQTILDGRPMMVRMNDDGTPDTLQTDANMSLALGWLRTFTSWTIRRDERLDIGPIIDAFFREFAIVPQEKEDLFALGREVGLSIRHGDFCRHNLLVSNVDKNVAVGVIDWTFSCERASPVHDLFFFLTTYYLQSRKHCGIDGFLRSFSYSFFETNRYSELITKNVHHFFKNLKIDSRWIRPLFGLFLMEQALLECVRLKRHLHTSGLPRFSIYLASFENKSYEEALREQIWVHFFQFYSRNIDRLVL